MSLINGTTPEMAREALDAAHRSVDPVDLSWLDPQDKRDSWTLADDTLRLIAAVVARLRPRRVVEFGSGVSTRLLASSCAGLDEPATLIALENDPVYERQTREQLSREPVYGSVQLELTYLVSRRWYELNLPVYDLPATVLDGPPAQLVLVDGPPLPLGGRHGSLLQAIHLGEPGTVVLLDDADRPSEQAALALAERLFGDHIEVVHLAGFVKGLAAIVVVEKVGGSAMPSVNAT
jgi:hypothetical protein